MDMGDFYLFDNGDLVRVEYTHTFGGERLGNERTVELEVSGYLRKLVDKIEVNNHNPEGFRGISDTHLPETARMPVEIRLEDIIDMTKQTDCLGHNLARVTARTSQQ